MLKHGEYSLRIVEGGVEVHRGEALLYVNRRMLSVTVKTEMAVSVIHQAPYAQVSEADGGILAEGEVATPGGSRFQFADRYEAAGNGFRVSRRVQVMEAGTELGFSTNLSLFMVASSDPHDYACFSPGTWYGHNAFGPDSLMGKQLDAEYYWRMETACALPLFAMRQEASGETISLSRWAADVTLRNLDLIHSENCVDPRYTIGSVGMSRLGTQTLNYMYYGFAVRTPQTAEPQGLAIDYVYPGAEGETPSQKRYGGLDFKGNAKSFKRLNHPVAQGFVQSYAVSLEMGQHASFQTMMREVWRSAYDRLRDKLFDVDNARHYHNSMKILDRYTRRYGESYGLPFACQFPDMDVSCVSFQFGFVGQQPGIGYHLLRYGDVEGKPEIREKGAALIDFWVRRAMTENGLPHMCYHPAIDGFEPYPFYLRMLADGMEAILDAWVHLKRRGEDKTAWLTFCRKTADWLVGAQNGDGSYHRAYEADGSVRMASKANTPSIIRFLVQLYLVTGDERYRNAAVRAGEWSLVHVYQEMEYRGGTCDNNDIQDKEAGIYGLFGFLALYDLTGEEKWLEASVGAADYTETWTYAWDFPVRAPMAIHPFNRYGISGQSIITVGGGADVYMAACAFVYYRLYVITGDAHYLDFAEFIHQNTRQSNDVDGSIGYAMPGLGHESGNFSDQLLRSHYHWLPWCTYVQVDPSARLYDMFGGYEIADAQRLDPAERAQRNKVYAKDWPRAGITG